MVVYPAIAITDNIVDSYDKATAVIVVAIDKLTMNVMMKFITLSLRFITSYVWSTWSKGVSRNFILL